MANLLRTVFENLLETRATGEFEKKLEPAEDKYVERYEDNTEAIPKVFRTPYRCVKSHLSFVEHSRLIGLQPLKSIMCDNIL